MEKEPQFKGLEPSIVETLLENGIVSLDNLKDFPLDTIESFFGVQGGFKTIPEVQEIYNLCERLGIKLDPTNYNKEF